MGGSYVPGGSLARATGILNAGAIHCQVEEGVWDRLTIKKMEAEGTAEEEGEKGKD